MVFQQELIGEVQPEPGGYGDTGCGGIVRTGVSWLKVDGTEVTVTVPAQLPVDLATSPDGLNVAVASAGASFGSMFNTAVPVVTFRAPEISMSPPQADEGPCGQPLAAGWNNPTAQPVGQVVAVARDASDRLIVQTREPSTLVVGERAVVLPGESRKDTGHQVFHMGTSAGLACASCHPEGREDGHTWQFAGLGPRRTQSIRRVNPGTEPFHWNGDMRFYADRRGLQ